MKVIADGPELRIVAENGVDLAYLSHFFGYQRPQGGMSHSLEAQLVPDRQYEGVAIVVTQGKPTPD